MSESLKEFDKWFVENHNDSDLLYADLELAWKAALQWVLDDLKAARDGFDLGLYDTLKKELNNE